MYFETHFDEHSKITRQSQHLDKVILTEAQCHNVFLRNYDVASNR